MTIRNLLFCSDNNYVCHLATAIESVLSSRDEAYRINIYVIEDGITDSNKTQLTAMTQKHDNAQIEFKSEVALFENATFGGHLSASTYFRLRAPDIFPNLERMLYLDCDVIVRSDIKDLFDIPLGDNYLAANPAFDFRKHARAKAGIGYERLICDLGFSEQDVANYVGAGILVLNLQQMRQDRLVSKFSEYIAKHGQDERFIEDQETLNMICRGRIVHYHPAYHLALTHLIDTRAIEDTLTDSELTQFRQAKENPKVVHFCGPEKPWVNRKMSYAEDYWRNRNRTPWKGSWLKRLFLN